MRYVDRRAAERKSLASLRAGWVVVDGARALVEGIVRALKEAR